jgi:transposase
VEQRDRRELTRYRTKLVQERTREVNRGQGILERGNIKVASVASDLMGASGRAILAALIEGRADPATMADLATGRLRSKIPVLEQALTGLMRAHHRQLLAMQLAPIDFLDAQLETLSAEITRLLTDLSIVPPTPPPAPAAGGTRKTARPAAPAPPAPAMTRARAVTILDTRPGVDRRGGELLVAEWGSDMARFGTAAHLAVWRGARQGTTKVLAHNALEKPGKGTGPCGLG